IRSRALHGVRRPANSCTVSECRCARTWMSTKLCTLIALTSCAALLPSLADLLRRTELGQELLIYLKRLDHHDRFPHQQRARAQGPRAHRSMVPWVSEYGNPPSTSSAFADCGLLSLVFNGHSLPLPHGPTGHYAP